MSENEIQLTAIKPPSGMFITVFNNSGTKVIYSATLTNVSTSGYFVVADNHVYIKDTGRPIYTYEGSGKFLGLSDAANSETPTYKIGSTYSYSKMLPIFYLVSFEYEKATVEYGGQILAREDGTTVVTKWSSLRITCEGLPMNSDVIITKIKGE